MLSGRRRNPIDKFYTKPDIVDMCLHMTKTMIHIDKDDLIIEPSAGNGSFLDKILLFHTNCIGYDIQPEHPIIINKDFLTVKNDLHPSNTHIIGNPPFGRQSMLCKRFIKKSIELGAASISFILPKSFKKEEMQQFIDPFYHLILSSDLPPFSFLYDKQNYHVPCVYQIWEKRTMQRQLIQPVVPTYWEYVKKNQQPDLSFRRIGLYAGTFDRNCQKSTTSHYFLSLKGVDVDTFLKSYQTHSHFTHDNTVGPKSISKHELNQVLCKLF
jgi:hypothetical protein